MDIVFIDGLEVYTTIGVYDWEKTITQKLVFDLELGTDIRGAASDDALAHTLDYAAISQRVIAIAQQDVVELLETLAEKVASSLMQEYGIPWLRLTLHKPGAVPQARSVGVRIERGSKQ